MSRTLWLLLIIAIVLLVIQLFRPHFENPPENPQLAIQAVVPVPPNVQTILDRSCYDCHSSRTRYPWYSKIAPSSWLLSSDVNEGRQELSFSVFGTYPKKKASNKLKKLCEEVKGGDMPPWYYTPMHPGSKLSDADRQTVCAWTTAAQQQISLAR